MFWIVLNYPKLSFEQIINHAGAFPDDRDAIGQRIILDIRNLTGEHINVPYRPMENS